MEYHLFWLVFVTYFSFFNKCETRNLKAEYIIPYLLPHVSEKRNTPPIVLHLEPRINERSVEENSEHLRDIHVYDEIEMKDDETDEDSDETILRTTQSDERAYILYHLLRTTIEEENIDPLTVQNLEPAKEFLRNAFIGRCRKLKKCMNKCPKREIKFSCNMQCKQVFDDLDECDEPKTDKCKQPKCGNTMPPSWLL